MAKIIYNFVRVANYTDGTDIDVKRQPSPIDTKDVYGTESKCHMKKFTTFCKYYYWSVSLWSVSLCPTPNIVYECNMCVKDVGRYCIKLA